MRVRNPPPLPEFKTVYTVIYKYYEGADMEEEVWKTVIYNGCIYNNIEVSNIGRLRNSRNGHIYKQTINHEGYYGVCISLGSRSNKKMFKVHKAVAEAFINNPDNKPHVNHKDGNKLNNNANNLEWITNQENIIHARDNGMLHPLAGEQHRFSKLTEEDVRYIRTHYIPKDETYGCKALAKKFNVDHSTISEIYHRKAWKHVA